MVGLTPNEWNPSPQGWGTGIFFPHCTLGDSNLQSEFVTAALGKEKKDFFPMGFPFQASWLPSPNISGDKISSRPQPSQGRHYCLLLISILLICLNTKMLSGVPMCPILSRLSPTQQSCDLPLVHKVRTEVCNDCRESFALLMRGQLLPPSMLLCFFLPGLRLEVEEHRGSWGEGHHQDDRAEGDKKPGSTDTSPALAFWKSLPF